MKKNKKLIALFSAVTMLLAPASSIFASDTPAPSSQVVQDSKASIQLNNLIYNLGNWSTHIYLTGDFKVKIYPDQYALHYIDIFDVNNNLVRSNQVYAHRTSIDSPDGATTLNYTGVNGLFGYHKVMVRSATNAGHFQILW
ncbi:hypothetical protein ABE099_16370 [Paenibacillus turicensis]|uniref:hypothetical protein n=1 Tax=Paenibacillus turicensis TaxID=160487 RepID=UPI003D26505D